MACGSPEHTRIAICPDDRHLARRCEAIPGECGIPTTSPGRSAGDLPVLRKILFSVSSVTPWWVLARFQEVHPLEKRELRESLEALHRQLADVDSLDEGSRDALLRIADDIEKILGQSEEGPTEHHTSLMERLREETTEFETSYPDLAALMQRAIDALTNMGI